MLLVNVIDRRRTKAGDTEMEGAAVESGVFQMTTQIGI